MTDQSTTRTDLVAGPVTTDHGKEDDTAVWSFGPTSDETAVTGEIVPPMIMTRAQPNVNGPETNGGIQAILPASAFTTVRRPTRPFGSRAWTDAAQWEGVVEAVENGGFRVRLTRLLDGGRPDHSRVEFADFELEELAYEEDRDLIEPGAVVYWTIGRHMNEVGTTTRQSLLRVRRVLHASPYRKKLAAAEAARLLAGLDGLAEAEQ